MLFIAAFVNEGRRLVPLSPVGESRLGNRALRVGELGREPFMRGGDLIGVEEPECASSPDAASVSRNSTQRREKDYKAH